MNFSWVHMWHEGDSVLVSLISLDRWLPFYWGDHRYGMPIPLLASWIRNASWNLLFQTQFFALSVVGLLLVGNLYFLHANDTPRSLRAGTACVAYVLGLFIYRPTSRTARQYFLADPYLVSVVPLLMAVALLFRSSAGNRKLRLAFAAALIFLALWINYSHVLLAGSLILLLPHCDLPWRKTISLRVIWLALTAALFGIVRLWASRYPVLGEPQFVPAQWFTTASKLFAEMTQTVVYPWSLAVLFAGALVAVFVWWRTGKLRLLDGLVFCLVALVFALAVTLSDWPMQNLYEPRYWTTPLALLLLTTLSWVGRGVLALLERVFRSRPLAIQAAALSAMAGALIVFGTPDPLRARDLLIATTGRWGRDALKLGCTHMVGDYSMSWMSVFHARALGHPMWAVVIRSEATRDLWDRIPGESRRYCGEITDQNKILTSFAMFRIKLPPPTGRSGMTVRFEYPKSQ